MQREKSYVIWTRTIGYVVDFPIGYVLQLHAHQWQEEDFGRPGQEEGLLCSHLRFIHWGDTTKNFYIGVTM